MVNITPDLIIGMILGVCLGFYLGNPTKAKALVKQWLQSKPTDKPKP